MTAYGSLCDDFSVSANLNSKLELPARREPVLHFFESIQKSFRDLTDFDKRDNGDFCLEGDRESGSYRWVNLESRRLTTGFVNPPSLDEVDATVDRVLEVAPFHLDMTGIDTDSLDVQFSFDLSYAGNHDEVVAEAFTFQSPLENLIQLPGARVLNFEPSIMLALEENCRLQCRLSIETRTNAYHIRTGQYPEAPISVYFTVRQYWSKQPFKSFSESYHNQRRILQDLVDGQVIPNVIQPLSRTIATKQ